MSAIDSEKPIKKRIVNVTLSRMISTSAWNKSAAIIITMPRN